MKKLTTFVVTILMMLTSAFFVVTTATPAQAAEQCVFKTTSRTRTYENKWSTFELTFYIKYYSCDGTASQSGGPYYYDPTVYGARYKVTSGHDSCHKDAVGGTQKFGVNFGYFGTSNTSFNPAPFDLPCQNDGANNVSHGFGTQGTIPYSAMDLTSEVDLKVYRSLAWDVSQENFAYVTLFP